MKENRLTAEIQKVLVAWDPLGDAKSNVPDLNDYEIEASDIAFHISLVDSEAKARRVIQAVLNQAFYLDLSAAECKGPAREIWAKFKQLGPD
jgi:hypothetical protein